MSAGAQAVCMLQTQEEPAGSSALLPGASPAGEPAPRSTTGSVADTGAKLADAAAAGSSAHRVLTAAERYRIGRIKSPAGDFYPPLPSGIDTSTPNISTSARAHSAIVSSLNLQPQMPHQPACLLADCAWAWFLDLDGNKSGTLSQDEVRAQMSGLSSNSKRQAFTLPDSLFSDLSLRLFCVSLWLFGDSLCLFCVLAAGRVRAQARNSVEHARLTAGLL